MDFKNELEYLAALKRLDVVFMADQSTPEGKEAAALVDAIEAYENMHHPVYPTQIDLNLIVDPEDNTRVVHGGITEVPLIESIITRSGYGVKLRFVDGSIGAVNIKDLSSEPVTDVTKVVVVDGQLGIHTLTAEGYIIRSIFPIVVWNNTKFL